MFSLIILVFLLVMALVYLCRFFIVEYSGYNIWGKGGDISVFLGLILVIFLWIATDYYTYRIEYPQKLIYYKQMVIKTQEVIDFNPTLNMKDIQMGRELTERILDYERFLTDIRIAKISPWTIFKPIVKID